MQSIYVRTISIALLSILHSIPVLCSDKHGASVVIHEQEERLATSVIEDFNFMRGAHQIKAEVTSISFGQATKSNEIELELAISRPQSNSNITYTSLVPTLQIFNHDCSTAISPNDVIFGTVGEIEAVRIIDGVPYEIRMTQLNVDVQKVDGSSIFEYHTDNRGIGKLQFCVRADIGTVTVSPGVESSISFVKIKFDIRLNMFEDFSMVQEILTVEAGGGSNEDPLAAKQEAEVSVTAMGVPDRPLSASEKEAIEASTLEFLQANAGPSITITSVEIVAINFIYASPQRRVSSTDLAHRRSLDEGRTLQGEVIGVEIVIRVEATNTDITGDVAQTMNEVMTENSEEYFTEVQTSVSEAAVSGDETVGLFDSSPGFGEVTASLTSSSVVYLDYVVDLDYDLNACLCDPSTRECYDSNPTISQNSLFMLCVDADSDQVVISSVSSLTLEQDGLFYDAIVDSVPSDPSVTGISSMGTNSEAVFTRMISVFFDSPEEPVEISMVVLLRFASSSTRQLVPMKKTNDVRKLAGNHDAQSTINLNIQLNGETTKDASTAGMIGSHNAQNLILAAAAGLALASFL
uniref:Uncharacterized protein n=1 Tax=Leptocylindrus danicus TaxID=163516 RepID=A0A7S2K4V6_9STRA|mmetsp:Transcript_16448/g.24251  ORF Transcript_16448/g.24251 Transcript_16448/m.24251 type:complete len:577 (+) Transcript_16448:59-1789(+)